MRSEGYCSCSVCVFPRPSSATKRQSRHTGGLSIVFASVKRRFSYNGFVSKIAVAFPYLRVHGSRPFCMRNGLIFRIPSVYYARDCTRAVNLYAHV